MASVAQGMDIVVKSSRGPAGGSGCCLLHSDPCAAHPAVGEVVESAVDTADSVGGVARSTTAAAASTAKRVAKDAAKKASQAAQVLENEETRRA